MELTTFRPYKIQNVRELFELHEYHTQIYMVRMCFTEFEYQTGSIDLSWRRLRLFIGLTLSTFVIIVTVTLVSLRRYPQLEFLNEVFEDLLQVKHIDMFWVMLCFTCLSVEKMCFNTLWNVLHYRFHHSELCFEYQHKLHTQLNLKQRRTLIQYFTVLSYASGIFYKLAFLGLIGIVGYLFIFGFGYYLRKRWNAIQLLIDFAWNTMLKVYVDYVLALLFIMVVHLLLMLQTFKVKLQKCSFYAKTAKLMLRYPAMLLRFQKPYVELYREMALYNKSINSLIEALDFIVKFSVTMVLIFFSKQEQKLVFFSYLIIAIFAFLFSYVQYVYNRFAYFPHKNQQCYKYLSEWTARSQYSKHHFPTRDTFRRNQVSEIKSLLKINLLTQSVGNNVLGFTMGQKFFITKIKHLEMISFQFFLLTLFYKKLSFNN